MVAEVGFEPHDLRVMSPTSYQAALLRDMIFYRFFYRYGAGDRGRTGTILTYHGILSPGRLPVPPHRRSRLSFVYPPIIPRFFPFVNPFFYFCKKTFPPLSLLFPKILDKSTKKSYNISCVCIAISPIGLCSIR